MGEPVYGPRDVPDIVAFRELGLPFWLAGSFGNSGKLAEALDLGAQGIQVEQLLHSAKSLVSVRKSNLA